MNNQENDIGSNRLFPVFLKLEQFKVLLVGGGFVALEKLSALLQNSPNTKICIISITFIDDLLKLAAQFETVVLIQRAFKNDDLTGFDFVVTAVNNKETSKLIFEEAHRRRILINTADTPDLCDFYLGAIVQKGNLKIAISTNGKSPTVAKRIKEWLVETIPNEIDEVLTKLHAIREEMKGDFAAKIEKMNRLTRDLLPFDNKEK